MDYYLDCEIKCCAQHVEAKMLANKLWRKWFSLEEKIAIAALSDNVNLVQFIAMCNKAEKVYAEFCNVQRGINRCCGTNSKSLWQN